MRAFHNLPELIDAHDSPPQQRINPSRIAISAAGAPDTVASNMTKDQNAFIKRK
jgi:hypothetical protein